MYLIYKAGIRPSKRVARGGVAYMDVGKERKRFRRIREVFAGNASSRCRSNRLIPAYRVSLARTARHRNSGEPKNIKASAW